MTPQNDALEEYLRRLGWSLAALPARDRDDIVAETRAHVLDRTARGDTLDAILAGFGAPETYARTFVDNMEISGALASERSGALLATVMRRAHRSAVAFAAFVILFALAACVLLAGSVAVAKIFDPVHAGLWVSDTQQFVGIIDDPSAARELLGNWIFAIAVGVCGVAWIVGRFVMLWAVRVLAGKALRRS